ncbi:MAG: alanine racemase [Acidobacteria bacterium]|nr:alanine racemase [Acidobacteriota bacterium]
MKSWVEISSERLQSNLRAIQSVAGSTVETLAVIKANAYGHDAPLVAPILVNAGVRWLGVTDLDEAARIRATVGNTPRILVMSASEPADATGILALNLTPALWTLDHIAALEQAAAAASTILPIHLEVDTGMSRQGVDLRDLLAIAHRLAASRWLHCEGVFTHLSSSEISGSPITASQRQRFATALETIRAAGLTPNFIHLGNTSALDEGSTMAWIRETAARSNARAMVRTGLALYGYCLPIEPRATPALASRLHPVLTWKTRILAIRDIEPGATVGYGATFRAAHSMRLALLPVGYADGFRRAASSGLGDGWVIIHAHRTQ